MNERAIIRAGSRESPLAMIQAETAVAAMRAADTALAEPGRLIIEAVKTTGDIVLDRPLSEIGGKGLFTRELDRALMDGRIDVAVHSMKDLETWLPDGMAIGCVLPRADVRDALVGRDGATIGNLPADALVGTASLRRKAQLLNRRPDVRVDVIRGNVQTRLRKVRSGDFAATFLAMAGLERLGMADVATQVIEPDEMLPACAQGAIGITCRADDTGMRELLAKLDDTETRIAVECERAMLEALDGSCRTPIAGFCEVTGDTIRLRGLVAREDGSEVLRTERTGNVSEAVRLGADAGGELKGRAGPGFFDPVS